MQAASKRPYLQHYLSLYYQHVVKSTMIKGRDTAHAIHHVTQKRNRK